MSSDVALAASTLNEMNEVDLSPADRDARITANQAAALARIHACVERMGPPPEGTSGAGALSALCRCSPYQSEATHAAYGSAPVSCPVLGSRPVGLSQLLGEGGREKIAVWMLCCCFD